LATFGAKKKPNKNLPKPFFDLFTFKNTAQYFYFNEILYCRKKTRQMKEFLYFLATGIMIRNLPSPYLLALKSCTLDFFCALLLSLAKHF